MESQFREFGIPEVSVIIPTYNRIQYLKRALDSVFVQSYQAYEVIVIDDGSTDQTADWIKKYYPQVTLLVLLKNRGASHARNHGILVARGKYLAFLDSDDQWKPQYLARQVENLETSPAAVMSWSDCLAVFNDKTIAMRARPLFPDDLILSLLIAPFIETMSCVTVRTESLKSTNLLNENIAVSHDNDLYLKLCRLGELIHVPDFLVVRDRASGQQLTGNMQAWFWDDRKVISEFFDNPQNQDYKRLEKDVWHALSIRDRLRTETNEQLWELWGRRMRYKFEMKYASGAFVLKSFFSDIIAILAFIKQQFLGFRRHDSERFANLRRKMKHFFYLIQRLWDPLIWTVMNYRP